MCWRWLRGNWGVECCFLGYGLFGAGGQSGSRVFYRRRCIIDNIANQSTTIGKICYYICLLTRLFKYI